MRFIQAFLFFVGLLSVGVESANVLAIFTSPSPSHVIVQTTFAKVLADQGHGVTVVTTVPSKRHDPAYKHILIRPDEKEFESLDKSMLDVSKAEDFLNKSISMMNVIKSISAIQFETLRSEKFQAILKSKKFDLVAIGYFSNDFVLTVAAQLRLPVVLVWSGPPVVLVNPFVGNPTEGSYVPNTLISSDKLEDFRSRLLSFVADVYVFALGKFGAYKYGQFYE